MQPCGLRDLARPRGRLSFGLKTKRFAGYARGTLAERGLKNIHATLWAAGFGAPSEATVVWPQNQAICGLRPRHLGPKGSKKHSCNLAGCENWHILGGDGRLASKPSDLRATPAVPLAQRGLKNIHATLAGYGIWRTLGGDGRLASRPSKLRIESAVPLAERGLKNIHATLRAAGFGAPSGATVVWPQGRASCGLHPRHLGPKGSKKQSCNLASCRI